MIAALDRNRVIGRDGKLPWHISEDLKRFKQLTKGHVVLMGRRTYESLGKPLPDRRNVVLSSHPIEGVESYRSLPEALRALKDVDTVFIIGGGEVFRQALPIADGLHLTIVEGEHEGDTFFPDYEQLIGTTFVITRNENHEGYSFVDCTRLVRTPS